MHIEAMTARDTFRVGRYQCTMTFANGGISTEWSPPFPPSKKGFTEAELEQYRAGRENFITRLFPDKRVMVVET
jgi:hypothetical protein